MKSNPFELCPDCLENRSKLKGILADFFPSEKIKINTLLAAFDEGIVDVINSAVKLDDILVGRYVKLLTLDYGLSETNARWAIFYWIDEYGVKILGKQKVVNPSRKPQNANNSTSAPPNHNRQQIVNPPANVVFVKKLQDDEKLPKDLIVRYPAEEQKIGITDFKCSVRKEYDCNNYVYLKITGEYSGKVNKYILLVFMIYNANGQLIGADFDEEIDNDFHGQKTFSTSVQVPIDEYISKIAIRLTPDPTFI